MVQNDVEQKRRSSEMMAGPCGICWSDRKKKNKKICKGEPREKIDKTNKNKKKK